MPVRPTQGELDGWLGTTADERATMRGGVLPERLRGHSGSGAGCLGPVAFIAPALVFGTFGAIAQLMLARHLPVGTAQAALIGAGLGLFAGYLAVRKLRDSAERAQRLSVSYELVELSAEPSSSGSVRLVASDGRAFRAIVPGGRLHELHGDYFVYYVDFSQSMGAMPGVGSDRLLLALEVPASSR